MLLRTPLIGTAAAVLIFLVLSPRAESRSVGILPTAGNPLTRQAGQTCGQCHSGTIGGPRVTIAPAARILVPNQLIAITVAASGGVAGTRGGFAATVTGGQFVPGAGTRVNAAGTGIAHSNPTQRSWTMMFRAPATPGSVRFHTVANTADGNGRNTGDQWAFHGSHPANTISTPIRLFVNAVGVVPIGEGCADGFGNVGVHGCSESPTVGNANFALEASGLPPSAQARVLLGIQRNVPSLDLTGAGAPGCFLHTDIFLAFDLQTRAGNVQRATGGLTFPMPIPNNAALKGVFFRSQVAVVDAQSGNALPVVFTNGLGITVQ